MKTNSRQVMKGILTGGSLFFAVAIRDTRFATNASSPAANGLRAIR